MLWFNWNYLMCPYISLMLIPRCMLSDVWQSTMRHRNRSPTNFTVCFIVLSTDAVKPRVCLFPISSKFLLPFPLLRTRWSLGSICCSQHFKTRGAAGVSCAVSALGNDHDRQPQSLRTSSQYHVAVFNISSCLLFCSLLLNSVFTFVCDRRMGQLGKYGTNRVPYWFNTGCNIIPS